MTDETTEFDQADLTGARFRKVQLTDADFRMVDLSGAVFRDVVLNGASIDGAEIDGLRIDGIEVAPLIEAELTRREPARALRRSPDPEGLRGAWAALEHSWAASYARVEALPVGAADVSVRDEWSFAQTLRHLVHVTDLWLGAALGSRIHPWGVPFADVEEFVPLGELGIDPHAMPTYAEVLALRAERVTTVRDFLATVTPEQLATQIAGPPWAGDEPVSVLRCVWVVLNEECEHHRFAERDLDAIAAG